MRRAVVLALALFGFVPAAEALTIRDVIELTRAGLGEEVLLALIEVDRGVYAIDPETLKTLKQAGVPDRVIAALVRSGREPLPPVPAPVAAPAEETPAPEPQVVVIDHHEDRQQVQEVMVPVPVYVPVPSSGLRHHRTQPVVPAESTYVPFQSGLPAVRPRAQQPPRPVYWGFGGKLRPDAWKPEKHRDTEKREDTEGREDRKK